ncbi:MAG: hypothetical protein K0R99_372 [Microbacterium sp.]|jgi:hypothetical protein|uniref:sugar ABC transporter ATPase n=1 Tax=Microbacterium sp. TaxID=51671 RepID=UPI0026341CDB|nr:sugar ABC transporter ATPase [Microbacterium sp.]MDF2558926.1 hypothetical protein [Microbacterium sp.]
MESTPEGVSEVGADAVQPLRDADATALGDGRDPAQAEWERTSALDEGATDDELDPVTATGADPDDLPAPDDEVPAEDLPGSAVQPESQGEDPLLAEIGEDGEGDLGTGDI